MAKGSWPDLYAVVELSCSLTTLINVEMRSQGWYAVRVKLLPDPRIKAAWLYTPQLTEADSDQVVVAPDLEAGPDEGWSWRSHVFRIQYCQDVIEFPEASPCFQVFIRQPDQLDTLDLCVELQLLAQTLGPTQLDAPCNPAKLRLVAKDTVRVSKVAAGQLAYHPASWGIDFWGLCHVNLATSLLGYSTRINMHSMGRALGTDLRQPTSLRARLTSSPVKGSGARSPSRHKSAARAVTTSPSSNPASPRSPGSEVNSPTKSVPWSLRSSASSLDQVLGTSMFTPTTAKPATVLDALHTHACTLSPDFIRQGSTPATASTHNESQPGPQLSEHVKACLQQLYVSLVAPLQQCTAHMAHTLRTQLPVACYYPQTYDAMRALLQDIAPASQRALNAAVTGDHVQHRPVWRLSPTRAKLHRFSGTPANSPSLPKQASTPTSSLPFSLPCSPQHSLSVPAGALPELRSPGDGMVAGVAGWDCQGPEDFLRLLPLHCTPGVALQYMHALISRFTKEATLQWSILQWVTEHSKHELTRHLHTEWQADQPGLAAPWTFMMQDVKSPPGCAISPATAASASRMAVLAHAQLQTHVFIAPVVHRTPVWDHTLEQPVLFLDDSLAAHMRATWAGTTDRTAGAELGPDVEAQQGSGLRKLKTDVHLMIFVHGYAGAPIDLGPIKAHIHVLYPSLECRFSSLNEGKSNDSMDVMGARLAEEVVTWVAQMGLSNVSQLSFVGHSLGVFIIRAALAQPKMAALLGKLWLLLSVGGPHLGQIYNRNGLVSAGMSVLRVVKRETCLQQLDLHDAQSQDPATSWLYCFITAGPEAGSALQRFKRVVLVACEQDGYVPYHSSELTLCEAAEADDSWRGKAYREMLEASLQGFGASASAPQLLRVGVHFPKGGRPKSSLIGDVLGRTAHIALIENDEFARLLAWGVVHKFNLVKPEKQPAWL